MDHVETDHLAKFTNALRNHHDEVDAQSLQQDNVLTA